MRGSASKGFYVRTARGEWVMALGLLPSSATRHVRDARPLRCTFADRCSVNGLHSKRSPERRKNKMKNEDQNEVKAGERPTTKNSGSESRSDEIEAST
jgi:hypothetical protein